MVVRPLKWLVFAVIAVVVVLFAGGASVLAKVPDLREKAAGLVERDDAQSGQSRSQLSPVEFRDVRFGYTTARLRELVGTPETTHDATVEGLKLECWYYGIVGESGSYQFCFADGKLRSKFRFVAGGALRGARRDL